MDIFPLLDEEGRMYPPVRQAAVGAKYSRSPESARVIVQQTPELKAEKFQKQVIVNWGHNSIGELATIPVCFEGVSVIASKQLEALPRPGCSEKSTRMQQIPRTSMCWPDPTMESKYGKIVNQLFDLYEKIIPWAIETNPAGVSGDNTAHRVIQSNIKKAAFDIARVCLPAGMTTNLMLVAYPRDLSKLIKTLGGSTNPELIQISAMMKTSLDSIGGPLIRHTEPEPWFQKWLVRGIPYGELEKLGNSHVLPHEPRALLVTSSGPSGKQLYKLAQEMHGLDEYEFDASMDARPFKTDVPDLFKLYRVGFDVLIDYGAMRDLQRHRRMNQYVEALGTSYGYVIPDMLIGSPFESEFCKLLNQVKDLVNRSNDDPQLLQYIVPMAFLHRNYYEMDLQQLYYLTELRTQPAGHISYRRIAWQMAEAAQKFFPEAMQWCRAISPEGNLLPLARED